MLTTVGRYYDPWEAHILRALLVAEGIPASVAGDQHIIANWPLAIGLGGAALQVPSGCLEQARALVTAYHAGTLEDPSTVDHCAVCGSTDLKKSAPLSQLALFVSVILFLGPPFPIRRSCIRCLHCGHRWRYGDEAYTPVYSTDATEC